MDLRLQLKYFLFIVFTTEGTCQLKCPKPNGNNCSPSDRPPLSCITQVVDGLGLTWFSMEENCAKDDGRLVWLKDTFTSDNLFATESSLNRTTFNAANFIAIGLLQSFHGDDFAFWRNPSDNKTKTCGSTDTDICLSSPTTPTDCDKIGCCWVNGKCQYPEHQWLPEYNKSVTAVSSAVSKSERRCVGLQKNGGKWTLKAYNCSSPAVAGTGYVCEYKCGKEWSSTPLRNVTWVRTASAGTSPPTSESSSTVTVETSESSSTVTVETGGGGNKARNVFDKQMMLMAYLTLLSLTYFVKLILF